MLRKALMTAFLAGVCVAPANAQQIIYGIEPGQRVYRGERVYPGEPVYPERVERAYPVPVAPPALEPMRRAAPSPQVQVIAVEEVADRLSRRGFRQLSPIEMDRGYYKLTAVDPAGNLIALSVSVVSGEIEGSQILQARVAPPVIFGGPERNEQAAKTREEPQPARVEPQRAKLKTVEPRAPEAAPEVAKAEPIDPPPLPRPIPDRPMPVPSVEDEVTTASLPEPTAEALEPAKPAVDTQSKAAPEAAAVPGKTEAKAAASKPPASGVALSDFAKPKATEGEATTQPTQVDANGVRVIYPPTTATAVQPQAGAN